MEYLDIHTHLSENDKEICYNCSFVNVDIQEVKILAKNENYLDFLKKFKYLSLGIHPGDALYIDDNTMLEFVDIISKIDVSIIGEIGLDKNLKNNYEVQKIIFTEVLEIANDLSKPVILHVVGAMQDVINLRSKYKNIPIWIIHGFRGKPQQALQYIKKGFYLSFGEKYNEESVRVVPIDKLFIETDVSDMLINDIYKNIAKIKGVTVNTLLEEIKKHINFF